MRVCAWSGVGGGEGLLAGVGWASMHACACAWSGWGWGAVGWAEVGRVRWDICRSTGYLVAYLFSYLAGYVFGYLFSYLAGYLATFLPNWPTALETSWFDKGCKKKKKM